MLHHGNWFNGVFSQRKSRTINCFLLSQKMSILAKIIAGIRLVHMCNYIAYTDFNCDFPKILSFFKLHSPIEPTILMGST